MKSTLRIILGSALITAAAIKIVPAVAEPVDSETRVSFVRTADLDLSSKSGLRQLDERLSQAAREVCGTASESDLAGKNDVRRCRDETIARARSDKDQVLARANGGSGGVIAIAAAR